MGRHSGSDQDDPTVPFLRMPVTRGIRSNDRSVRGVAFPVVDDLSLIASDDRLLDSIAAGRTDFGDLFVSPPPISAGYVDTAPAGGAGGVAALLAGWRGQVVDPPMPPLPSVAVPQRAMHAPADRRRSLRPMLAAGAAICALLMGSTAVGAQSAQPGDALWGLTRVLYSDHALSLEAKVVAGNLVIRAGEALANGETAEASQFLKSARGELARVLPTDGPEKLQGDVTRLQGSLQVTVAMSEQATQATEAAPATSSGSSPGHVLNAATSGVLGTVGGPASSAQPPATGPGAAAAPVVPGGNSSSPVPVAVNPVLVPAPTLPPESTLPPASTAPVAPITEPTTVPVAVTVTTPSPTPPVDPPTPTTIPGPVTTDPTVPVVAPTTPSTTDPATPTTVDPPATTPTVPSTDASASTTSVMPPPSSTDVVSSVLDVSGAPTTQTSVTGP